MTRRDYRDTRQRHVYADFITISSLNDLQIIMYTGYHNQCPQSRDLQQQQHVSLICKNKR